MKQRAARLGLLVSAMSVLSAVSFLCHCAQVLGYDELSDRPATSDAGRDATLDTGSADVARDVPTVETDPDAGSATAARPPQRPTGDRAPSGKGKTIWTIAKRFQLGALDSTGTPTKEAWRGLGYDIDRTCTGPIESDNNTGTCLRPAGAQKDSLVDGVDCRDNNFGGQFVPLIALYDAAFEQDANDAIARGNNTWILVIDDLDDGRDDAYAPGRLYKAADFSGYPTTPPKFDGTDIREIDAVSVTDHDLGKPRSVFPDGYVRGNTWVSGEGGPMVAPVPINSVPAEFNLVGAVITLQLLEDHSGGSHAVLAGGLPYDKFEGVLAPVASAAGFCPGTPLYDSLLRNVKQLMDLVEGAPFLQATGVECNTMSVGIAFDVANIQPATRVVDAVPIATKCKDAGT